MPLPLGGIQFGISVWLMLIAWVRVSLQDRVTLKRDQQSCLDENVLMESCGFVTMCVIGAWSIVLVDVVLYLYVFPFMLYDIYEMSCIL